MHILKDMIERNRKMKKLVTLLLIGTLVIAGSVYAFADETVVCELDPEVAEKVLEIKDEFLAAKVNDGTLTQAEADAIEAVLETREGHDELRDLGFGIWLQENDYMDELYDILPRKGGRDMDKGGSYRGNMTNEAFAERRSEAFENGTCTLTDEEIEARRTEMTENGGFMGRGRRGK